METFAMISAILLACVFSFLAGATIDAAVNRHCTKADREIIASQASIIKSQQNTIDIQRNTIGVQSDTIDHQHESIAILEGRLPQQQER